MSQEIPTSVSPAIRRAGELALSCIRDAAPGCDCRIEFGPGNSASFMVATITATIDGVSKTSKSEFGSDPGRFSDEGNFLGVKLWLEAKAAFGL